MELRINLIVKNPKTGYPGILPISRHAFLDLVAEGYFTPGKKIGRKIRTWAKPEILEAARNGVRKRRIPPQ